MGKRYGVIFTCLTRRAVQIEVAQTIETDSIINSLQRFMVKHGKPEEMRSDNGRNFKGGNRELTEAIKQWNHNKKLDGALIPHTPLTCESSIRTVKKVLR